MNGAVRSLAVTVLRSVQQDGSNLSQTARLNSRFIRKLTGNFTILGHGDAIRHKITTWFHIIAMKFSTPKEQGIALAYQGSEAPEDRAPGARPTFDDASPLED